MDEFNAQAVLDKIARRESELSSIQRQLSDISVKSQSDDGLIEVTVGAAGAVQSIRLAAEVFRRSSPRYLADAAVATIQQAARKAGPLRKHAGAPAKAIRDELATELGVPAESEAPPANRPDNQQAAGSGASDDHTVQAVVNGMGIVSALDISPTAFRGSNPARLELAIVQATQRAAHAAFEFRSDALPYEMDELRSGELKADLEALYPVPPLEPTEAPTSPDPAPAVSVEPPTPAAPPAAQSPQPEPPRRATAPGHLIPGTRKPNRDAVFTPEENDDDDDYFEGRRNGGWLV